MSEDGTQEDHANALQDVIAVDENDEPQGTVNRLDAHTGDGIRHRAFTALLFDEDDNVLLAQRASSASASGTRTGTAPSPPTQSRDRARRRPRANDSKRNSASPRPVRRPASHRPVRVQALLREFGPRVGGLCRPPGHAARHRTGSGPRGGRRAHVGPLRALPREPEVLPAAPAVSLVRIAVRRDTSE